MSNEKDTTNTPRYKSCNHMLEMYLDTEDWRIIYGNVISSDYDIAYIHHNKDGCKEHVHAVVMTSNQTYNTALSKELGIDIKWIQQVKKRDSALRYLIHLDDSNKYQYDESEVMFTSERARQLFSSAVNKPVGESEDDKVLRLVGLLDNQDRLTYRQFVMLACQNGLYDVLRRSNYLFCRILEEHNNRVGGIKDGL